jgi:phosphoglycolate phosphatase
MNDFRVVVFDYDGTLFDTRPAIVHCIQRAFAETLHAVPPLDAIAATVATGLSLPDTLVVLDQRLHSNRVILDELARTYRRLYLAEGAPLPKPYLGVGGVLRRLHAEATKCLVVSNKGVAAIQQSLDASDLTSFIDEVFGDQPGLPKKPEPGILTQHILPRYAPVTKAQILVVGDTETDIVFAKSAGVASCWASYGYGDNERCLKSAPNYVIGAITELPGLVLGS